MIPVAIILSVMVIALALNTFRLCSKVEEVECDMRERVGKLVKGGENLKRQCHTHIDERDEARKRAGYLETENEVLHDSTSKVAAKLAAAEGNFRTLETNHERALAALETIKTLFDENMPDGLCRRCVMPGCDKLTVWDTQYCGHHHGLSGGVPGKHPDAIDTPPSPEAEPENAFKGPHPDPMPGLGFKGPVVDHRKPKVEPTVCCIYRCNGEPVNDNEFCVRHQHIAADEAGRKAREDTPA